MALLLTFTVVCILPLETTHLALRPIRCALGGVGGLVLWEPLGYLAKRRSAYEVLIPTGFPQILILLGEHCHRFWEVDGENWDVVLCYESCEELRRVRHIEDLLFIYYFGIVRNWKWVGGGVNLGFYWFWNGCLMICSVFFPCGDFWLLGVCGGQVGSGYILLFFHKRNIIIIF